MGHFLPGSEDNYYESSNVEVLMSLYGRLPFQQQTTEAKKLSKATGKEIGELKERLASRDEELKERGSEVELLRAWLNRIYDELGVDEVVKLTKLLPNPKAGLGRPTYLFPGSIRFQPRLATLDLRL